MSDYQRRYEAAAQELRTAGVWQSNALPPCTRLLPWVGLKPIPPHYIPLWRSFLSNALSFTLLFAFVSLSGGDIPGGRTLAGFLLLAGVIGSVFGLVLVCYYAVSRKRHALSRWSEL